MQQETDSAPQAPKAAKVKLVPYKVVGGPQIAMLQPEGWQVFRTISGDGVQISMEPILIHVMTRKLRAEPPTTLDEYRKVLQDGGERVGDLKQVQIPGTVSAFLEVDSYGRESPTTDLTLKMYGTTFSQAVSLKCPTDLYPEWEPVFRQILDSFEHSNLDAIPLPSTP